jgi:AMOP domain
VLLPNKTTITAKLSDDELVSSVAKTGTKSTEHCHVVAFNTSTSTDLILHAASGTATFTNLPQRTITFEAVGPGNELGTAGTNPTLTSTLAITVFGFKSATNVANKDFSKGLSGWNTDGAVAVSLQNHIEQVGPPVPPNVRSLQLNQDLALSTGGSPVEQRSSHTFTSSDDACAVKVRYRFVTSEVPGGYFGTQFNDYYRVSIRAENSKDSVSETMTMNGLGIAAFDFQTGSTNWKETILVLNEDYYVLNDKVQVDLAVANVADGLLDSNVEVDFVEEIFPGADGSDDDPCACAKCEKWYKEEIKDVSWISDLPRCPCSVVEGSIPCTVRPTGSDEATGIIDGINWSTDLLRSTCGPPSKLHPGAKVCIRADGPNGTGQQCCYGDNLRILEHGTGGAGTPDRSSNVLDHLKVDVKTWEWCCVNCKKLCSLYIGTEGGKQGARSDPRHASTGCSGL